MGYFPRYIPTGSLVEVTTRTLQGRLLLVPSRDLNDIVCGILGRALVRYAVELVDFVVMGPLSAEGVTRAQGPGFQPPE